MAASVRHYLSYHRSVFHLHFHSDCPIIIHQQQSPSLISAHDPGEGFLNPEHTTSDIKSCQYQQHQSTTHLQTSATMSARYERVCCRPSSPPDLNSNQSNNPHQVNAHADDDDDHHDDTPTPTNPTSMARPSIPNSPPPSFHSRASSIHNSQRPVNPDLADAFGADEDDDDSDDDADDRQRLMRRNSSPTEASGAAGSTETTSGGSSRPGPERQTTQLPTTSYTPTAGGSATQTSGRVYGGGIQNEGVFSNLTAKPERNNGAEKEELPPVRIPLSAKR